MTSLKNFFQTLEPALIVVSLGFALTLLFSLCQYFSERRRRGAFRRMWNIGSVQESQPQSQATLPTPQILNWLAGCLPARRRQLEVEPFPSFPSFFVHHVRNYGYAILLVTLALIIRQLLEPMLEGRMPFSFFLAAVILTARTQGIWETALALVLGFCVGSWFFATPKSLGFSDDHDWWAAGLYFVIGVGIIWFLKSERAALLRSLSGDIAALRRTRETLGERPVSASAQKHRELFASVIQGANLPILTLALDGRISSWNPAAEKLFGWTAAEIVGRPAGLAIPSLPEIQLEETAGPSAHPPRVENARTMRTKTGEEFRANVNASAVYDRSGALIGISLIILNREGAPTG